jgi:hypothetical protein
MSHKRRLRKTLRKKRQDRVQATVTALRDDITIVYDTLNDKVYFPDARTESIHQTVFYDKDSGKEKTCFQIPCGIDQAHLDHLKNLKAHIDFLFAVDTNTVEIAGEQTAFSMSYLVPNMLSCYEDTIPISPFFMFEINHVCSSISAERIGWHLLIQQIIRNPTYHINHRIGIVSDHELNLHAQINKLRIPYYGEYYLPDNMQLVYASDKGWDYLANQMVSLCDKAAAKTAKYFRENNIRLNVRNNGDSLFRGFRRVVPKPTGN